MRGRPPKSPVVPSRKIWVDSECCSRGIIDQLLRMAHERRIILTLVSSRAQAHSHEHSPYVRTLVVSSEFGDAPARIAAMIDGGDIVVTSNAGLASTAGQKSATALNPGGGARGERQAPDDTFSPSGDTAHASLPLAARIVELLAQK
ncbi:MAG TPA: DUF188 domain-containing protein [Nevskiaceae bacterium]|nr:DUF188 domain-containing protein [Nevskiaceae bacterium]